MTGSLWSERDYVVPSPNPILALSQTPQGILVEYDAEYERNGEIQRRAYYLEPNFQRIEAGLKPVFVNPAKAGPQTVIPILERPPTNQPSPALYAICSSNLNSFTLYRPGQLLGPCALPAFEDRRTTVKVALTPLAVTGDAIVVGSVVGCVGGYLWVMAHSSGPADRPDP